MKTSVSLMIVAICFVALHRVGLNSSNVVRGPVGTEVSGSTIALTLSLLAGFGIPILDKLTAKYQSLAAPVEWLKNFLKSHTSDGPGRLEKIEAAEAEILETVKRVEKKLDTKQAKPAAAATGDGK